jgi:hypothetical protein
MSRVRSGHSVQADDLQIAKRPGRVRRSLAWRGLLSGPVIGYRAADALAPLFLVAAQRSDDRDRFMKNLLVRHRRALLVYSIYGRAQAHSGVLTEVQQIVPQILEDQQRSPG